MQPRYDKFIYSCTFLAAIACLVFCLIFAMEYGGATAKTFGEALNKTAAVISAVGIIFAIYSWRTQEKEGKALRTYDIMQKYRNEDFKIAERFIKYQLREKIKAGEIDLSVGLVGLQQVNVKIYSYEAGREIECRLSDVIQTVTNFYNTVGTLAAFELVDTDFLFTVFGPDMLLSWDILHSIIKTHDRVRISDRNKILNDVNQGWSEIPYQAGFAYLVEIMKDQAPSDMALRLRTYRGNTKKT